MKLTVTQRAAVGALFCLSGFSGLVYEVLWTRSLTLVFGNTVLATSTVLAAYMGGLALGSYLVGRFTDRSRNPLRIYGILEAIVGVSALAFPWVLGLAVPVLRALYREDHLGALAWVRFLVAFLFLLIPTAAMGGTLPVLARLLTRVETSGRTLATLYALNTLGATVGTLAAGFWLIPTYGLTGTLAAGVALNLLVAASAVALSRPIGMVGKAGPPAADRAPVEGGTPAPVPAPYRLVLWAFLLSGALALALEVLWTRSLLLVFGSTVYSFSTMLAVFLLGLTLGSSVVGRLADRLGNPALVLGLVQVGIAFVTLASVSRMNGMPSAFLDGMIAHGFGWSSYMIQKALIAASVLLPVSFLFGATFPLVARVEVFREERVGRQVGLMYAFNTLGAIAGSLGAGFLLLPWLGLQRSLLLVALLALGLGVLLLLAGAPSARLWPRAALAGLIVAAGLGAVALIPPWNPKILSAGVYFRPSTYLSPDGKRNLIDQALGDLRVLEYIEGLTETAAVVETPDSRMFLVDGKVEAATDFVDMRLQRLQSHLPMLLAPRMDKALNIGLGCGITLGSLKVYPLKTLQCVELERSILTTARFFSEANHQVLDDPRLKIILNDGRNHLLLTDETYDVITSDPFEPLVGGAASLYTEDHFRNARARLTPGGIFCQYLPMYQLSPDDYRMIIRSFCRVYPHATLWYTGIDSVLVGSVEPQRLELAELARRMALPGVKESLAGIGITDPVHLLQTFVCAPGTLPDIAGPGPVNTDRHPAIEFSAPRSHLANTTPKNLAWLLSRYRPEDLPLDLSTPEARAAAGKARAVGRLVMEAALDRFENRFEQALVKARQARDLDPQNRAVLFEVTVAANPKANALIAQGQLSDAKALLDEAWATGQEPFLTLGSLATLAFRAGKPADALLHLQQALALNPNSPEVHLKMALCLQALNRASEAMAWCDKALALNPKFLQARLAKADMAMAGGDRETALAIYQDAREHSARDLAGGDWLTLGQLLADKGRFTESREALERAVKLSPQEPRAWYILARVAQAQGDRSAAQNALQRASAIAPDALKGWMDKDPAFGGKP